MHSFKTWRGQNRKLTFRFFFLNLLVFLTFFFCFFSEHKLLLGTWNSSKGTREPSEKKTSKNRRTHTENARQTDVTLSCSSFYYLLIKANHTNLENLRTLFRRCLVTDNASRGWMRKTYQDRNEMINSTTASAPSALCPGHQGKTNSKITVLKEKIKGRGKPMKKDREVSRVTRTYLATLCWG